MAEYLALIHKVPSSDFGVSFPDFPGCVTAGRSMEDARLMAEEALAFHIEGMIEDGKQIPSPSSLAEIMRVREYRNAAHIIDIVSEDRL
ncbi:type II toxin-antitoxin system HicB family antitoxin [Rhizobium sp. TH2]|uniref:type II toxin-antitoxin system HicB family antitoxin n=1 Tax=Rhizobium sp. TH2 TaxID=2775403 RepID=UPI0021FCA0D9|nr:type II toxin-antitoxin system HicB family antitoxin [Rhizobium sp. TH2]